ncbi:alpha/beta fold hydrolase [Nonomuraea aurantiaca]|uniref:alpha/beta fold hydrolase n=1 Tax=Nonomuraea aurantiaca TaxID=2878562 RepID=UPI001CDA3B43|nr:alpha/beta fold hydrolase [Nonomuraea aurantiaca]MCA2222485.1 alpha/beta fold hydrolase [Nonomuraea aurantiaca]
MPSDAAGAVEAVAETALARFHYARAGSGPPVLLLPGAGGWRFTFQDLIPVLSRHHTVYALDPPGQGSTEILDRSLCVGTDGVARLIGDFLEAVGVARTAIVGHSWGGGFALRFAELHPDAVTRLALIAPGGLDVEDAWEFRLARLPVVGELVLHRLLRPSVRHMLIKSFAHRDRVPEGRIDDLVRTMRSSRLDDVLRVERSVSWAATERDLHLVRAPVLLLWGDRDRYFPASLTKRFAARLPQAEAHIVSGGGHSLHDDCPEETGGLLIRFLAGTTADSTGPDR